MNRASTKLIRNAAPFSSDVIPTNPPSSSLQLIPPPTSKPPSSPLYTFLPESQNPNELVNLISSSLKHPTSDLRRRLRHLLPRLGPAEISRVLLRSQSDPTSALSFFNWVKSDLGLSPSPQNYSLLVHILAWSKLFKPAMELLSELILLSPPGEDHFPSLLLHSADCNFDPAVLDMLVKAQVKLGRVNDGFLSFFKSIDSGYTPTVSSCNCLLNGLLRSNLSARCWEVYEAIKRIGVRPNSFTFNILTHAFCRDGDVAKVGEFLERMEEEGFESDVVTYNTLIHGYCRKGRIEDACYLYGIMYRRGLLPDLVSYTALMNGLCREGKVKEAHVLFDRMIRRGLNADVVAYNVLISGYCERGRVREGKALLYQMIGSGVHPDRVTSRVLIQAYARKRRRKDDDHGGGGLVSAVNLAVELERLGAPVSNDVYDYLVARLCEEGKPFAARSLVGMMMSRHGYEPGLMAREKLVVSLCEVDCTVEALLLVEGSSAATYKAVVSCLCRTGRSIEAEAMVREMVRNGMMVMVRDVEMCRVLVFGCCKERDIDRAQSSLEWFATEGGVIDGESYHEVARVVCEEGGDVVKLQKRMAKVGYEPSGLTFVYAVRAMAKSLRGVSGVREERESCSPLLACSGA